MNEFDLCPKCGGVKSLKQPEHTGRVHTGTFKACVCKPEPAQKHDGNLGQGDTVGYDRYHRRPVHVQLQVGSDDIVMVPDLGEIAIAPHKALSLLAWLQQEKPELERLAKEQERG